MPVASPARRDCAPGPGGCQRGQRRGRRPVRRCRRWRWVTVTVLESSRARLASSGSQPPGDDARRYRNQIGGGRQVEREDRDAEANADSCKNEEGGYQVSDQGGGGPKQPST